MIETWMVVTVAAAALQSARTGLQKHLTGRMGTSAATFTRFGFGLPFALLYFAAAQMALDAPLPGVGAAVLVWAAIGGGAQIGATFLLVRLSAHRSFAVGNAYARTEPMHAALLSVLLFGAAFDIWAALAIGIAVAGVMAVSVARLPVTPLDLVTAFRRPAALIGLASGLLFGLAAVGYQQAARSVVADHVALQAAATIVIGLTMQTAAMGAWLLARKADELARLRAAWRPATAVGFTGATATLGWFVALTLQEAALVKVLAQVEMLFAFAIGALIFREPLVRLELLGCTLIMASVLLLLGA